MPLYFSRPLSRGDYVLAKFAAMASALFVLMAVPLLVLYGGAAAEQAAVLDPDQGRPAGGWSAPSCSPSCSPASGCVIASITPRRGFGVAAIIAVLIVASLVVDHLAWAITHDAGHLTQSGYFGAIAPYTLVDGVAGLALRRRADPAGRSARATSAASSSCSWSSVEVVGCYAAAAAALPQGVGGMTARRTAPSRRPPSSSTA